MCIRDRAEPFKKWDALVDFLAQGQQQRPKSGGVRFRVSVPVALPTPWWEKVAIFTLGETAVRTHRRPTDGYLDHSTRSPLDLLSPVCLFSVKHLTTRRRPLRDRRQNRLFPECRAGCVHGPGGERAAPNHDGELAERDHEENAGDRCSVLTQAGEYAAPV